MITVSAPGKVHLTSGHIVVYGKPALLSAVDLRTTVKISEKKLDGKIEINSQNLKISEALTVKQILEKKEEAKITWRKFNEAKDLNILKKITSSPMALSWLAIGEALSFLKENKGNLLININSQIPIGSNFGSSAALSASLIGGIFAHYKQKWDLEKINELTYEVEKISHGFPSGGDNTVIVYGGLLWFRKETEDIKLFKRLNFKTFKLSDSFLIIDSGKPEETTVEMVNIVCKLFNSRPKHTQKIFNEMEGYKKQFVTALVKNDLTTMQKLLRRDERDLERLGVVSEKTKKIVRDIEYFGASVGISGAAGRKNGSGALVILARDKKEIINYCQNKKLKIYNVNLLAKGLRVEKNSA